MKGAIWVTKKGIHRELRATHSFVVVQAGNRREVYLEPDRLLKSRIPSLQTIVASFETLLGQAVDKWWLVRNTRDPELDPFVLWNLPCRDPEERGRWVTRPDNVVTTAYAEFRQRIRTLLSLRGVQSNPAVTDDWIIDALQQLLEQEGGGCDG